jgi:hypothetical protein
VRTLVSQGEAQAFAESRGGHFPAPQVRPLQYTAWLHAQSAVQSVGSHMLLCCAMSPAHRPVKGFRWWWRVLMVTPVVWCSWWGPMGACQLTPTPQCPVCSGTSVCTLNCHGQTETFTPRHQCSACTHQWHVYVQGDARGCFPPDLGQGVNSALGDVEALGQVPCLGLGTAQSTATQTACLVASNKS